MGFIMMVHHDGFVVFFVAPSDLPTPKIVHPACREIFQDAAVDAFYRMHLEGRDMASAAEAVLDIYKDAWCGGNLPSNLGAGSWVNLFPWMGKDTVTKILKCCKFWRITSQVVEVIVVRATNWGPSCQW